MAASFQNWVMLSLTICLVQFLMSAAVLASAGLDMSNLEVTSFLMPAVFVLMSFVLTEPPPRISSLVWYRCFRYHSTSFSLFSMDDLRSFSRLSW